MSYFYRHKIEEADPVARSQQWIRERDAAYDREMYRWAHSQPGGNCDINREIFRLKHPKSEWEL